MKKTAIIYYSGTGNTETLAKAIFEAIKENNGDVNLFNVSEITPEDALKYDVLVLGCSAKGVEELEEAEFEPFYQAIEPNLAIKDIALFGSYGWGGGEFMRTWEERVKSSGAHLIKEGLTCLEAPDDVALEEAKLLGSEIAKL